MNQELHTNLGNQMFPVVWAVAWRRPTWASPGICERPSPSRLDDHGAGRHGLNTVCAGLVALFDVWNSTLGLMPSWRDRVSVHGSGRCECGSGYSLCRSMSVSLSKGRRTTIQVRAVCDGYVGTHLIARVPKARLRYPAAASADYALQAQRPAGAPGPSCRLSSKLWQDDGA